MKKSEAIQRMKNEAVSSAFKSRVYEEIASLGLNVKLNLRCRDESRGQAFGLLNAIYYLDDKFDRDALYYSAVEDATQEILKANKNCIDFDRLYVLAGHDSGSFKSDIDEFWARVRGENQIA